MDDDIHFDDETLATATTPTTEPAPPREPLDYRVAAWARIEPLIRPAVAIALVVIAYHYSLSSLVSSLDLDTPLAHLGLVPFIVAGLALIARRAPAGPDINDRQLDWIIGVPLVATALAINILLPARLSTMFWVWRIDLLTLPVFLAGVVSILFGVRSLWRYRLAILFLFLAWPWPYTAVLDRWLTTFTNVTIAAVTILLKIVPVASRVVGGDGSTFAVKHGTENIPISVATECSGANGLVGFLLVGTAFLLVVRGPRAKKLLWLGLGAVLVWALNVLRIVVIFAAAHTWGESVAIDGFHPYIGLVVFNLAVLAMVLCMTRFDLEFALPGRGASRPTPPDRSTTTTAYRPSWRIALVCVAVPAALLSVLNTDLQSNDTVATSLGSPRLSEFAKSEERPDGWDLQRVTEFPQYKRFFGASSTWVRYQYLEAGRGADLSSNMPVIADIIETSNRGSLDAYGIEACYRFHGFKISGQQSVDLGAGVVGGLLTWTNTDDGTTWTTLYWHWPIKTPTGTRYERVTLLLQDSKRATYSSPPLDSSVTRSIELSVSDALASGSHSAVSTRVLQARSFLVSFGRALVANRAPAPSA